jgi:PAS domain S-box-containing protein
MANAASTEELQGLFDAAPVAILLAHDPECRRITGNRFAYQILGLPGGNVSRTAPDPERINYRILRNGVDVPPEALPLQRAAKEGVAVLDQELEFAVEGRPSAHVTCSSVPLLDAKGAVRGAFAVYTDITARRRGEELLRLITDNIPALIAYVDRDFRYQLNNRVYGAWFGEERTDVSGKLVRDVLGEAAWDKVRPYMETALAGVQVSYETEIEFANGDKRWVSASYIPHIGPTGQVEGLALFANDLTDRHAAEEALHRSEETQRLLVTLHDVTRALRDPARVMFETVTLVGRYFDVIRCAYGEVDAAQEKLTITRGYTVEVPSMAGNYPLEVFGEGLVAELRAGRTAVITDLATDPRTSGERAQAIYQRMEIRSMVCVPLVKEGRFAALLVMCDRVPRQWEVGDAWLLEQVAERTWLALENARAEAALREADRRKDEFLATLAHELRNPLAPIRTAIEIVQQVGSTEPRLRTAWEIVDRQVHHMTRLVDDLLDVARITRGKIRLRRQDIELAGVLRDAVESARPYIESSGHSLQVALPEDPVYVNADPTRLTQIFFNLLNNAAKFTPPGGHLWLTAKREGGFALISVRDDGRGVAPEHLSQLFEMFAQVSPALERSEQGLGIGLALVRGLVELHGGSVEAFSDGPDKGSEFVVKLPASEPVAAAVTEAPSSRSWDMRSSSPTMGTMQSGKPGSTLSTQCCSISACLA